MIVDEKNGKLTARKNLQFVKNIAPAWLGVIPYVGPVLAAIAETGVQIDAIYLQEPLDPPKEQVFDQFFQLLEELSESQPVVLFIDDLQWIDTASLDLLFHIARTIKNSRLLLVCCYRPSDVLAQTVCKDPSLQETLQEMRRYSLCYDISLGQMTRIQIQEMVDLEFPDNAFPLEFITTLHKRSGGNPLFVSSFLELIKEQEFVQLDGDTWHLAQPLDLLPIPKQPRAVIKKRLERLSEELRDICDLAAVEGVEFTYESIDWISRQEFGSRSFEVGKQVRLLQNTHKLISRKGERRLSASQTVSIYSFAHGMLREVLYEQLSPALRQNYHRLTGEALERLHVGNIDRVASELAFHFKHGKDYHKAARYFFAAGETAHSLFATSETIYNLKNSIELFKALPADERDLSILADSYQMLAHTYGTRIGYFNEGIELYDKCLRIRKGLPDQSEQIMECLHMTGVCYRCLDQFAQAREYYGRSMSLSLKLGDTVKQGNILRDIGASHQAEGDWDSAADCFQKSFEILRNEHDRASFADTLSKLGSVSRIKGEYEQARAFYQRALDIQKQLQRPIHEMMIYEQLAALAFDEGDEDKGFSFAQMARDLGEKHLFYYKLSKLLRGIARKYIEYRHYAQAFNSYAEAVIVSRKCNELEYYKCLSEIIDQMRRFDEENRRGMARYFCALLLDYWRDPVLDQSLKHLVPLFQEIKDSLGDASRGINLEDIARKWVPGLRRTT